MPVCVWKWTSWAHSCTACAVKKTATNISGRGSIHLVRASAGSLPDRRDSTVGFGGAPYVCIEPWYGIADPHERVSDVSHKQGIQRLESNSRSDFAIQIKLHDF